MLSLRNSGYVIKPKKPVKRQTDTKTQWNTLQVSLFYSFHLRKSKVYRYLAFADLSNIFLIQSLLLFSTVACNATPARHLWYVNYITPFLRNVSLGCLCRTDSSLACERQTFLLAHRRWGKFRVPQRRWARRNVCRSHANLSPVERPAHLLNTKILTFCINSQFFLKHSCKFIPVLSKP